jgi:hypothetical protein
MPVENPFAAQKATICQCLDVRYVAVYQFSLIPKVAM